MQPSETNISICGHVKHGKSTLAGRLIYELGAVSNSELGKLKKEAEGLGKDFNEFSLIFLRGRSMTHLKKKENVESDPSRTPFPARGNATLKDGRRLTLVDTPGHDRYLDNIVYGVYLADFAVLLVEAKSDLSLDERTGTDRRTGTKDITRILSSFRIPVLAIFVTKMDTIGYSEMGFDETREQIDEHIMPLLREYHPAAPPVIPISALSGIGIGANTDEIAWYKGKTALEVIEAARTEPAHITDSLRVVIEGSKEVYSPPGAGTVLVGSLETGELCKDDELMLEPASTKENRVIKFRARSIQRARTITEKKVENETEIVARSIVAIAISDIPRDRAERYLAHGGVLGRMADRPSVANEIEARLIFFEPNTVYSGKNYFIPSASSGRARIHKIENKYNIKYDLDETLYTANAGEIVTANLILEQPICIESDDKYQRLTRFVLREHNRIVACGRCTRILS